MPNERIENAIDLSLQVATGEIPDDDMVGVPILRWLSQKSDDMPIWWSFGRDDYLRNFWKEASHLATLMYTAQTILTGVPLKIEARDPSITSHVDEAALLTDLLMNVSEFGESLYVAKRKFIEDLLGTDNGAFMEVLGDGPPDGPIKGLPLAVRHLDSACCWRTSNPEYPVVYHDPESGKAYKLHRSRVIYMSQMTSPIARMNGVGFCAVSRSIQFSRHLYDIYIHKQEKLGSRPISVILVGAGFKGGQIMKAVGVAQMAMNNQGLRRYARTVAIGSEDPNATIKPLILNNFDPFDEETAVSLAMYGLSAAFGIPIHEVWPTSGGKSARGGDHQESRQRGKLPAEFNSELELNLELKYLPPYLKAVHDYHDDYQDERRAINQDIRARNRERDLGDLAIDIRTARQNMVSDGDISREQFRKMELKAGRREGGESVMTLYYSKDKLIRELLDLGVEMPTNVLMHDSTKMLSVIAVKRSEAWAMQAIATSKRTRDKLDEVIAALEYLAKDYASVASQPEEEPEEQEEELEPMEEEPEPLLNVSPDGNSEGELAGSPASTRQPAPARPARMDDEPKIVAEPW